MDLAVGSADGDRYDRQKRIWWMDMDAVADQFGVGVRIHSRADDAGRL